MLNTADYILHLLEGVIAVPLTVAVALVVDVFILCCECLRGSLTPGAVGILDATIQQNLQMGQEC